MPNPHLPQELLDHIIDLLDDDLETLKECSLVAKSWIPRTQKHIFATVEFTSTRDLQSWKRAFPNPSKSPACYTRSMYFGCPEAVVAADAEEGGWLRAFSHLANLHLESNHSYLSDGTRVGFAKSFAPFYVFSPTLKSLRVPPILFQSPDLWTLMHSSPLLENLGVTGHEERDDDDDDLFGPRTVVSSTSPPLTGSLDLHIFGGMGKIASELLELPSGLHFRSLILLLCHKGDVWWMTDLVERCFDTLECLEVTHRLDFDPDSTPPINLSKATRLRDVAFRPASRSIEWIAAALQTITPEHRDLRQISIHVPYWLAVHEVGGEAFRQWLDIDRTLVQLWESLSVRPRVGGKEPVRRVRRPSIGHWIRRMLPEATKRGIIDPIY